MKIQSESSPESQDLVREFLSSHYSGILATADSASNPHAAVVYYTLESDLRVTFGTKTETQKFKNIQENDQVAFVVFDEKKQTTVQVFGRAKVIEDHAERQKVINNIFTSSAEISMTVNPPAEKLYAGDYVAVRIVPQVIKMAIYARPDSEGDDIFETLLFSE